MANHPLHHFETFLCVAISGGFTAAANKMGVSKSAVSNTIRLLEESLKTPLFIRTTRSIRLTEEGEMLLLQCQKIKIELDTARDLITGFNKQPSGHLRISCNPYFSEDLLIKAINKYSKLFPNVTLEIFSEERMPDMAKEQIDIVFGINWPAPLDIVARPIGDTRYVLCASPEYLQLNGSPKTIKDLEKHAYIPHSGRTADNIVVNLKQKMSLNISPQITSNSAHLMKTCALKHLGIIQLHDYMVKDELNDGRLVEILSEFIKPAIPLYVYYQKHRFVQPKIKKFIELIFANL